MSLLMEPGQTYNSWDEFKTALDTHHKENKVIFNIANAKTVEQSNAFMKRGPFYDPRLKYSHCVLQCKHYGSYTSVSAGLRPKQRSYKIDCRAFISVSACRKENYLIIRDSYHKHSHPCTEEIFNSYPEVRRMTRDERRMVGTLLDMGVPVSQIKTAVGKNVTPKDLHNAKVHMRAVKMGIKSDERKPRAAFKRSVHLDTKDIAEFTCQSEVISPESQLDSITTAVPSDPDQSNDTPQSSNESSFQSPDQSLQSNNDGNNLVSDKTLIDEKTIEAVDAAAMSNLVTTLSSSGESVFTVTSGNTTDGDKTSYTVIVSAGEDEKPNTETVANLQELFHKLQTEGFQKKPTRQPKTKVLDQIQECSDVERAAGPDDKNCEHCGKYMSPLDGHSLCLACLGPQHLHQHDCEACSMMKPEQLNIRRKLLVRMRMKALKKLNESKQLDNSSLDHGSTQSGSGGDNSVFQTRKSKRIRKPKNFGPDMSVQNIFSNKSVSPKLSSKVTKCVVNDGEKEYMVEIPKREIDNDYPEFSMEVESSNSSLPSQNTERFNHLLKQTTVFDDVVLRPCDNGVLGYEPDVDIVLELNKAMSQSDIASVPTGISDKYSLDSQFESSYCSVPSSLDVPGDPVLSSMGSGLHKLAQNATTQTKLAIYDKLFTRLGVGMADEALDILSQLYGKVTHVTEISQEDLTNNLQTALDTIQALKDVLEELGLMSTDALATASHQRSISFHSLEKAKKALRQPVPTFDEAQSCAKRRKFEPFTKQRRTSQLTTHINNTDSHSIAESISNVESDLKLEVTDDVTSAGAEQHHIVMEVASLPSDSISQSVLTPIMAVSPMALSSELLERLHNQKDGVIQLNMVKEDGILLSTDATGQVEVHEVIQTEPETTIHTTE